MGIASKLIRLMREKNTNANELATKAGIPPTTVYSLIRRDSSRVDIDSLIKIAKALGTTADYLCSEDYGEEPEQRSEFEYDEVAKLREELKNTPGMRTLFSAAKGVSKEDLEVVAEMIKRMKKESGFED